VQPRRDQELRAGESQDADQADLEVAQLLQRVLEHQVQGAQAEDREQIRAVEDEAVLAHRECRRDRVEREHDIGELDSDQCDQERRRDAATVLADQEVMAVELRGRRQPARDPGQALGLLRMRSRGLARELDRGDQEDRAEHVRDPMPALERRGTADDEQHSRAERAEDAPREHPPLFGARDRESAEHDDEQKQIIDREALLEQVRGEPLFARFAAELQRDEHTETDRDPDPADAPQQSAASRIDMIAAVRDQIDHETNEQ